MIVYITKCDIKKCYVSRIVKFINVFQFNLDIMDKVYRTYQYGDGSELAINTKNGDIIIRESEKRLDGDIGIVYDHSPILVGNKKEKVLEILDSCQTLDDAVLFLSSVDGFKELEPSEAERAEKSLTELIHLSRYISSTDKPRLEGYDECELVPITISKKRDIRLLPLESSLTFKGQIQGIGQSNFVVKSYLEKDEVIMDLYDQRRNEKILLLSDIGRLDYD